MNDQYIRIKTDFVYSFIPRATDIIICLKTKWLQFTCSFHTKPSQQKPDRCFSVIMRQSYHEIILREIGSYSLVQETEEYAANSVVSLFTYDRNWTDSELFSDDLDISMYFRFQVIN